MAEQSKPTTADRRTVLRTTALGVAAAGIGATAAACSSSNSMPQGSNATTAQTTGNGAATGSGSGSGSGGGSTLATTSQVPVNGGFINQDVAVVVTQPSAGEYKAFTAVCTHAQCIVASVSDNVIQCNCHGSQYNAATGAVVRGPAPAPLAAKSIKVDGSNIVLEG